MKTPELISDIVDRLWYPLTTKRGWSGARSVRLSVSGPIGVAKISRASRAERGPRVRKSKRRIQQ